ncbi:MAG: GIY-YIG nuclease family protein [Candidatus Nanoarchaeia archaeon]
MKGVYLLEIYVSKSKQIKIGSLGYVDFMKGSFFYVGSAQNNLEKRIKRHLSVEKTNRWHIDYLLSNKDTKVVNVYYKIAGKDEECKTSKELSSKGFKIKGFGSSDCKCTSHLIRLECKFEPEKLGFYLFRVQ